MIFTIISQKLQKWIYNKKYKDSQDMHREIRHRYNRITHFSRKVWFLSKFSLILISK